MIEDLRLIRRQLRIHQQENGPPVPAFGVERPGVFGRQAQLCRRKQAGTRARVSRPLLSAAALIPG